MSHPANVVGTGTNVSDQTVDHRHSVGFLEEKVSKKTPFHRLETGGG